MARDEKVRFISPYFHAKHNGNNLTETRILLQFLFLLMNIGQSKSCSVQLPFPRGLRRPWKTIRRGDLSSLCL